MSRRHLVAVAAAGVLAGCGGGESDRDAVREYIGDANALQQRSAPDLEAANAAYRRLARGRLNALAGIARLDEAVAGLRETRDGLAALDPPDAAAELHRRLLDVYDRTAALSEEVSVLGAYLRASSRIMDRLPRFSEALQEALSDAEGPAAQERALARYEDRLDRLEQAMRRLTPPDVLVDAHRAQLLRLDNGQRLSTGLRRAVEARDSAGVARLVGRFAEVFAATPDDVAVQRRAIRAYRDRVQGVSAAVGRLRTEQSRLERSLG